MFRRHLIRIAVLPFALAAVPVLALQAHSHDSKPASAQKAQAAWGIAAEARAATRTITIDMSDAMRFTPASIEVKQGEVIRFDVANSGKLPHEMVIGTRKALEEHAAQMAKAPHAQHDATGMVNVAPGRKGEFTWHFNRVGEFDFACLVPGHLQAGMAGRIKVVPARQAKP